MSGSSASGSHLAWVSTVVRLPMSWPKLADSNLNPQPRQLWLMSHPYCVGKRWKATITRNDDSRLAKLYEARRAGDYSVHLTRGHAVQVFRMRVNHVLLLSLGESASCRLCEHRVDHVLFDCPALEDCRSSGWGCQDRATVLWSELSVLVEAAKLMRVFLWRTNE